MFVCMSTFVRTVGKISHYSLNRAMTGLKSLWSKSKMATSANRSYKKKKNYNSDTTDIGLNFVLNSFFELSTLCNAFY